MKTQKNKNFEKPLMGFTYIEILIAVVILAFRF